MKLPRKLTREEWDSLTYEEQRKQIEKLTEAIDILEDEEDEEELEQKEEYDADEPWIGVEGKTFTRGEWAALTEEERDEWVKKVTDSLKIVFVETPTHADGVKYSVEFEFEE